MKNLVLQISIKSGGFDLIKMNLVQTVLKTSTPKISVDICISTDNVSAGGPIYRSVSNQICFAQENNKTIVLKLRE